MQKGVKDNSKQVTSNLMPSLHPSSMERFSFSADEENIPSRCVRSGATCLRSYNQQEASPAGRNVMVRTHTFSSHVFLFITTICRTKGFQREEMALLRLGLQTFLGSKPPGIQSPQGACSSLCLSLPLSLPYE